MTTAGVLEMLVEVMMREDNDGEDRFSTQPTASERRYENFRNSAVLFESNRDQQAATDRGWTATGSMYDHEDNDGSLLK